MDRCGGLSELILGCAWAYVVGLVKQEERPGGLAKNRTCVLAWVQSAHARVHVCGGTPSVEKGCGGTNHLLKKVPLKCGENYEKDAKNLCLNGVLATPFTMMVLNRHKKLSFGGRHSNSK
jgi:hypothetical protein